MYDYVSVLIARMAGINKMKGVIMARPERKDVDYFPFYLKDGRTLHILEGKYECKGTGFFTNLFRFLGQRPDHHFSLQEEGDRLWFFSSVKCDEVSGMDMINIMTLTGKLDCELWKKCYVIASQDFLDSVQDAYRNRINKCITLEEIKDHYRVSDVRNKEEDVVSSIGNTQESDVSDTINPQTKVKYTKVKEVDNTKPTEETIIKLCDEIAKLIPKKIFNPYTFNNKHKKKRIEARLYTLQRCKQEIIKHNEDFIKDPWPYLNHIVQVQHLNEYEKDAIKEHEGIKDEMKELEAKLKKV